MIVRFEMARGEIGGGYRGRVGLGQRRPGGGLGVHFRSRSTDGVGGILRGGGAGIESAGLGTIGSYNNNDRRTTFLSARGLGAGRGREVFSAANDDDGLDELRVLHDLNDLALQAGGGGSSNATENLNPLLPETLLDDQQQHRLWELSMGSGGGGGPQYASSSRNFGINTNGMGRSILDELYNHNNNNNNNIFTPLGDGVENGGVGILLEGFGGGGGGGVSSLCLDDSSLDLYGI